MHHNVWCYKQCDLITKNFNMKHTKKYLDAMWVIENPDKYDERDVLDAKRYTNAYLEGYTQALLIADVVGRSEQLKAFADFLQSDTANLNYDFKDLADEYLKSL